jgi:hypothetical protein
MRGAFFVRGAAALAGNLALFFGRHRSKTTSFLPHCVHGDPPRGIRLTTTIGGGAADHRCARALQGGCHPDRKDREIKPLIQRDLRETSDAASAATDADRYS